MGEQSADSLPLPWTVFHPDTNWLETLKSHINAIEGKQRKTPPDSWKAFPCLSEVREAPQTKKRWRKPSRRNKEVKSYAQERERERERKQVGMEKRCLTCGGVAAFSGEEDDD